MVRPEIVEFANNKGYETVKYLCEWDGFKCYSPVLSKGKSACIGLPVLILEDDEGNIRMSTTEEAFQVLMGN